MGNQGGGGQQFGGPMNVPHPGGRDYGPEFRNLISSNAPKQPESSPVSFGSLGSYTFNQPKTMPAPPRNLPPPPTPTPCKAIPPPANIKADEAKDILTAWAGKQCCGSAKGVKDGHVDSCFSTNALLYTLETFTESRFLIANYSSCRPGENLDGLQGGSIVNPWAMPCTPDNNFVNHEKRMNLPHTDVVQPCFRCNAFGKLRCGTCNGTGRVRCGRCNGSGRVTEMNPQGQPVENRCGECEGRGEIRCPRCEDGAMVCDTCMGTQSLKWFLQVLVRYTNHVDEYINEKTSLPDQLVESHQGDILCQCEGAQLMPISDCDSNELNQNSLRLIQKAVQSYANEKQLLQRHALKSINVTECECTYETKDYKFWIVGEEREVIAPDYPTPCCCPPCICCRSCCQKCTIL